MAAPTATATANTPIYQDLVEEQGDVLAASRAAAQETRRAANELLGWARPQEAGESPATGTRQPGPASGAGAPDAYRANGTDGTDGTEGRANGSSAGTPETGHAPPSRPGHESGGRPGPAPEGAHRPGGGPENAPRSDGVPEYAHAGRFGPAPAATPLHDRAEGNEPRYDRAEENDPRFDRAQEQDRNDPRFDRAQERDPRFGEPATPAPGPRPLSPGQMAAVAGGARETGTERDAEAGSWFDRTPGAH
ncbi:hypothetical protein [Streptomyces zingiberis]|uniref:Translation initiation factor IF-2 n=1 Tax=Streptomyces zingiberis TaxID=2053010 RepID=A0ABX1C3R4_9ACTN|nr:hypothetical protein [Streptomyces zingiberis]NJQ03288.1 hypothetical protein [Streptomyces zingiberis]